MTEEHISDPATPSQIATPQWVAEQMREFGITRKKNLAKNAGVNAANLGQFLRGNIQGWGGAKALYWYFCWLEANKKDTVLSLQIQNNTISLQNNR